MNFFLIDGLNLAYRAHNVNFELRTASGISSGMFYGFIRTIFSLKKKYRGYKFIVAWDNKAEHKYALQPDYKAGRVSLPDTVFQQVPDIKEYLHTCGVDQYEKYGQEADDIIASIVEMYKSEADTIIIYSNDKDFLQLVETGKIIVYKPKVGLSPEKFYDEEAVKEAFGVVPKKLACYRSFDGDASDNLKGVPRVPRKIIANMVMDHNSVEEVYDALGEIHLTEYQRNAFEECRETVLQNYKIMQLDRYIESMQRTTGVHDTRKMTELLKKYEVKSIDPEAMSELFASSLNIRYSEPRSTVRLESYSLF